MIRSRRIRLFCATLLAAGAVGLGWLVPARWLKAPVPRAVIPEGTGDRLFFSAAPTIMAPFGSVVVTVSGAAPPPYGNGQENRARTNAIRLWDGDTGKLRAELLRFGEKQFPWAVQISTDGKRLRVLVADLALTDGGVAGRPNGTDRCWDLETATECDAKEPFAVTPFADWDLFEGPDSDVSNLQVGCSPMSYARNSKALAFLAADGLRVAFAGERHSRKIVDTPGGRDPVFARRRDAMFALSPDAGQLVVYGLPHLSSDWPLVDRVRRWLDPAAQEPDPTDDEDEPGDPSPYTYVADVTGRRVVACWPTSQVRGYFFSADGRTLGVVSAEQTALYDAPLREPWLERLAIGLAAGTATFLLACVALTPGALRAGFRMVVHFLVASGGLAFGSTLRRRQ
jgi:hypothetical protein